MSKIKDWLIKVFRINVEPRVLTQIDQELATKDSQIKALLKDNQNKSGTISKFKAEEREKENKISNLEEEEEKEQEITDKQNAINREIFKDAFSLKEFFTYLAKNPKYEIDVMDRDMSTKLADFGDLVFFNDGELGIIDKNKEVLSKGKSLNNIFFKPGSLMGQINRKVLRLPCDRNFRGLPDLEEIEMPEVTYNSEKGLIKWAQFSRKPLKKLLVDREETINYQSIMLQEKEESISMLVKSNREHIRKSQILESKNKTMETEMSVMMQKYKSMHKKFRNLSAKLAQSQSMRTVAENLKNKYKESLDTLSDFVAEKLSKTDNEIFTDKVKDMVDWLNEKIPQPQTPPPIPTPTKPVQTS